MTDEQFAKLQKMRRLESLQRVVDSYQAAIKAGVSKEELLRDNPGIERILEEAREIMQDIPEGHSSEITQTQQIYCSTEGCSAARRENARYCHRCGSQYPSVQGSNASRGQSEIGGSAPQYMRENDESKERMDERGFETITRRSTLSRLAKSIGVESVRLAFDIGKPLTYPILGNLPASHRRWLQDKLGEDVFNEETAANVSLWTNFISYSTLAGYISYELLSSSLGADSAMEHASCYALGGFCLAVADGIVREAIQCPDRLYPASIIGKILTLPVDFVRETYRKFKKHASNIHKRTLATENF
ncbi:hypothetical protein D6817_01455 [Candidatus Pacearchaeota archaeon]|nr:MAG: hypothetical protein D6817_01455 [Candidatus Pacearchaeota archaeon]